MTIYLFFFGASWRQDDSSEKSCVYILANASYVAPIHRLLTSYDLTAPYAIDCGSILRLYVPSSFKYVLDKSECTQLRCSRRSWTPSAAFPRPLCKQWHFLCNFLEVWASLPRGSKSSSKKGQKDLSIIFWISPCLSAWHWSARTSLIVCDRVLPCNLRVCACGSVRALRAWSCVVAWSYKFFCFALPSSLSGTYNILLSLCGVTRPRIEGRHFTVNCPFITTSFPSSWKKKTRGRERERKRDRKSHCHIFERSNMKTKIGFLCVSPCINSK